MMLSTPIQIGLPASTSTLSARRLVYPRSEPGAVDVGLDRRRRRVRAREEGAP